MGINKNKTKSKAELAHNVHVFLVGFYVFVIFDISPIDIGMILTLFYYNHFTKYFKYMYINYLQKGVTIWKQ